MKNKRLRMFDNRMLRNIYGPKREDETEETGENCVSSFNNNNNNNNYYYYYYYYYYYTDQITETKTGGICGICEGEEKCIHDFG